MSIQKRAVLFMSLYLSMAPWCMTPVQSQEMKQAGKPGLFSLGANRQVSIGSITADNFWLLDDASRYQEMYTREFNIVTPENQLKFRHIQPQRDVFTFAAADRHVRFAEQHDIAVHGHTLIWHRSLPEWLLESPLPRSDMIAIMNHHIDTVMGHYKGRIKIWDVVNEPITGKGKLRHTVWHDRIGEEYIELALRRARQADPSAKLLINDYNVATINRKSTKLYNLTKQLLERGVPLDGIGFQMHLSVHDGLDFESFSENLQRFSDLGLALFITELDVAIHTPVTTAKLQRQASLYRDIFLRLLSQKTVKSIQMWGFTDKYSWIDSHFPGHCCGLIYDKNWGKKLSYTAISEALVSEPQYFPQTVTLPAGSFDDAHGVDTDGAIVFNVDNGDWIQFNNVDLKNGFAKLRIRYGNGQLQPGNWRAEVRLDSPSGVEIAKIPIVPTGGWDVFRDKTATITGGSGRHTVYVVFKGDRGAGHFDWVRFEE
ncbi:MAG: endo-1,4-beta-xylanase [Nitrospirales bacterium]|nr:endo-1,4-beta-xylanase [Nitrospira sp.]MDR4502004.1 endo-1,4-beta-xylanase [Nitrospirales bacterium]